MVKLFRVLFVVIILSTLYGCKDIDYEREGEIFGYYEDNVITNEEIDNYIEFKTYMSNIIIEYNDSSQLETRELHNYEQYLNDSYAKFTYIVPAEKYVELSENQKIEDYLMCFVEAQSIKKQINISQGEEVYEKMIETIVEQMYKGEYVYKLMNGSKINLLDAINEFTEQKNISLEESMQEYMIPYLSLSNIYGITMLEFSEWSKYEEFTEQHPKDKYYNGELEIEQLYDYTDEYFSKSQKWIDNYISFKKNFANKNIYYENSAGDY